MAGRCYEQPRFSITGISGADFSALRYRGVYMNSSAEIVVAGVNAAVLGVIQTPDIKGVPVNVMVEGISFIEYGDTVAAGSNLTTDATGRGIPAVGTAPVLGVALCSGNVGEIGSVLLINKSSAGAHNKFVLSIPVKLAKLAVGDVITELVPGFAGQIEKAQFLVTDPATTAGKAATLNLEIGTVDVTGGVIALTSANTAALGAVVAGSAITAKNTFSATDEISVEAASVTAFVEGEGVLLLTISL